MDATERRKRASEEATEWLVVLQGDVTHAQREQFIDWLRESSVHVAEMLRVAQVHGALEHFDRWARIPTDGSGDDDDTVVTLPIARNHSSDSESGKTRPRNFRLAWPIAAMFVVAAVALGVLVPHWRGQIIETDRAERREVALADGSVVQVDPETKLRVKYEDHVRYVFLDRGRALFHVAKNKNRPFLVQAEDTMVRAVGTAFAVERQFNVVLVTVAEGKVEVIPSTGHETGLPSAANASPNAELGGGLTGIETHHASIDQQGSKGSQARSAGVANDSSLQILLVADEQVAIDRSGSAHAVQTIDSSRALAWAEGRLVFDYTSLGDAVDQFNKYNRIQLLVSDQELANRPISGVFNASDPESFVAFIQSVTSVRLKRTSGSDIAIDPIN